MSTSFLSFSLDHVLYALEVNKVRSILEYTPPVKMPCTQDYVEGLINMRGEGITVINLRKKFGMKDVASDKNTRIVIVEICNENHSETAASEEKVESVAASSAKVDGSPSSEKTLSVYGLVVDSVKEVVNIEETDVDAAPKFGNSISEEFIKGIGKQDGEFLVILNPEKVFATEML